MDNPSLFPSVATPDAVSPSPSPSRRRPTYLKIAVAEWNSDPRIKACDLATLGLLVSLRCLMRACDDPGFLPEFMTVATVDATQRQSQEIPDIRVAWGVLAAVLGADAELVRQRTHDLVRLGLLRLTAAGALHDPEIASDAQRDEATRAARARGGREGAASRKHAEAGLSGAPPAEAIVMRMPVSGVGVEEFGITEAQVREWSEAFPAVDVVYQLGRMRQWCLANPRNRKTPMGIARFVVTWLDKEQNNARVAQGTSNTAPARKQATPFVDAATQNYGSAPVTRKMVNGKFV